MMRSLWGHGRQFDPNQRTSALHFTAVPSSTNSQQAMHISVTTLKRLCRRHGVKRWPHRQINGINKALSDLEVQHEVANGNAVASSVMDELRELHRRRDVIIEVSFRITRRRC